MGHSLAANPGESHPLGLGALVDSLDLSVSERLVAVDCLELKGPVHWAWGFIRRGQDQFIIRISG